jgi:hypothetical protein
MQNPDIARLFDEVADLLEIQDANPFRVRAYRNAARTIRPACSICCGSPGSDRSASSCSTRSSR